MFAEINKVASLRNFIAHGGELVVNTVHSFQGRDCDTIIYDLCLDPRDSNTFALNENLLNVALSRARHYLFIVGDKQALLNHRNKLFIANLLKEFTDSFGCVLGLDFAVDATFQNSAGYKPHFDTKWELMLYNELLNCIEKDEFFINRGVSELIFTQLPMMGYRLDMAMIYGNRGLDIECDCSQHYKYWISPSEYELVDDDKKRAYELKQGSGISFDTIRFRNMEIEYHTNECALKVIALFKQICSEVDAAAAAAAASKATSFDAATHVATFRKQSRMLKEHLARIARGSSK